MAVHTTKTQLNKCPLCLIQIRVLLLGAEPSAGIRLIPLSTYLKDYKETRSSYKGQMVIASLKQRLPAQQLNRGISLVLMRLPNRMIIMKFSGSWYASFFLLLKGNETVITYAVPQPGSYFAG